MLIILSPAKTMQEEDVKRFPRTTLPQYLDRASILAEELKKMTVDELARIMKVNMQLALLNYGRFNQWKASNHSTMGTPALLSYQGEVFRGLNAASFQEDNLHFAQKHLRILSGFYGILRPLDLVLPYRLEMGGRFSPIGYRSLYDFWTANISKSLDEALTHQGDRILVNLASNEYFKSIDKKHFSMQIITPVFMEAKGDGFKMVTVYAKKARGTMARFIIKNRIKGPEELKLFDEIGYYYNESLSRGEKIVFTR